MILTDLVACNMSSIGFNIASWTRTYLSHLLNKLAQKESYLIELEAFWRHRLLLCTFLFRWTARIRISGRYRYPVIDYWAAIKHRLAVCSMMCSEVKFRALVHVWQVSSRDYCALSSIKNHNFVIKKKNPLKTLKCKMQLLSE